MIVNNNKMATLTFKTMSSSAPAYLSDLIQTAVPVRPLRSSYAPLLTVPRTRSELARRAFSVASPRTWNSLPSDIRSCRSRTGPSSALIARKYTISYRIVILLRLYFVASCVVSGCSCGWRHRLIIETRRTLRLAEFTARRSAIPA